MRASRSLHCIRKLIVRAVFQTKYVLDSFLNSRGVLPYISHVDVCRLGAAPKGMVLRRFGLKTGIDFAHFGLESGMVFEGTTGMYEGIYRFNSK